MSLVKLYYLQKISILIFFILNFINGEKVEDRTLSPYNSIPGYELEDWSKSPDFGILNIISNLPIDSIEFDRIEPSEKIDNFIWTSPKVALPYGSYEVKYNPQKRFYDRIDTLIVVERQKTKKIDFSLPLKKYSSLDYDKYSEFDDVTKNLRFVFGSACGIFLPSLFAPWDYGLENNEEILIFFGIFSLMTVNELINDFYLETINSYKTAKVEHRRSVNRFLESQKYQTLSKNIEIDNKELKELKNEQKDINKEKFSLKNFIMRKDREPRLIKPIIINVNAIGIAPNQEFITQLKVHVSKEGVAKGAVIKDSALTRYDSKARIAAENAKYYPGRKNGQKQDGWIIVEVIFRTI